MKITYKVLAAKEGWATERLEEGITSKEEADLLVKEYGMAYGRGWIVWKTEED